MRYLLITGDHPRHLYFAKELEKVCCLECVLLEKREAFVPKVPDGLDAIDRENFLRHFANREKYEKLYFGAEKQYPNTLCREIDKNNVQQTLLYFEEADPDVVFVFGSLSYAQHLQPMTNKKIVWINLNTGLMQRYNGDATLFWPFYFLEPQWAGSTFHLMNAKGNHFVEVIHQCTPKLMLGETIHEVAAKVLLASVHDLPLLIHYLKEAQGLMKTKTIKVGKMFMSSDFKVEHLRVNYTLYHDHMVDAYLKGHLRQETPKLVTIIDSKL